MSRGARSSGVSARAGRAFTVDGKIPQHNPPPRQPVCVVVLPAAIICKSRGDIRRKRAFSVQTRLFVGQPEILAEFRGIWDRLIKRDEQGSRRLTVSQPLEELALRPKDAGLKLMNACDESLPICISR